MCISEHDFEKFNRAFNKIHEPNEAHKRLHEALSNGDELARITAKRESAERPLDSSFARLRQAVATLNESVDRLRRCTNELERETRFGWWVLLISTWTMFAVYAVVAWGRMR